MFIFEAFILLSVYVTVQCQGPVVFAQIPVCASAVASGPTDSKLKGEKGDQGIPGRCEPNECGFVRYPQGCPGVTFHLPRDNQVTDYVQYRAYIPQMKEVTICAWIETEDYDNHATFYSYASTRRGNELFGAFFTTTTIRLAFADQYTDFSHTVFEGRQKVHICGWYSSINEECGLNINGIEILSKRFSRGVVRGGGSLILGQEQDRHNAQSLDASQAFSGNITNFMMWPRVLSSQEILGIATNCECPHDYSVAMTMDKSELHGETSYSIPRQCPTL